MIVTRKDNRAASIFGRPRSFNVSKFVKARSSTTHELLAAKANVELSTFKFISPGSASLEVRSAVKFLCAVKNVEDAKQGFHEGGGAAPAGLQQKRVHDLLGALLR